MAWMFEPPANITDATGTVVWINSVVNQWLFQGILSAFFVVTLVSLLNNQANTASKSFAAATFTTMIIAVFVRTLNLIPTWFMSIWIVLTGLSAVWMYVEGTQ